MIKPFRSVGLSFLFFTIGFAGAQVPGTGRVQIKDVKSYSGTQSLGKPASIVVYNFAVTPEEVKLNSAALHRVRTKISHDADSQKTELARKIVDDFSGSLIKDLEKSGLVVSRGEGGEPPPANALVVQGDFLQIDEGNRTRRMAVGLGAGSSKVQAHVECYLTHSEKNVMVTEFKAISQSSRKPGAAETIGAGAAPAAAAAVSGVTEMKQDTEGDTGRMAKAVAKEITRTLARRGWIPEPK